MQRCEVSSEILHRLNKLRENKENDTFFAKLSQKIRGRYEHAFTDFLNKGSFTLMVT